MKDIKIIGYLGACILVQIQFQTLLAQAITTEQYIEVLSPLNNSFRTEIYPSTIYQRASGVGVKTTTLATTGQDFTLSTNTETLRFVSDYNPISGPLATWYFKNSGGSDMEVMTLNKTGDLFIKTLTNIGDFKNMQYNDATGQLGWDNSSRRYKINISTLKDDWTKILNARPVKYSRPASPDHWEYGYIAEEMDSIGLRNLVGYDQDGIPDDVKYDKMVVYLTEMIKIQQNRITELSTSIAELRQYLSLPKNKFEVLDKQSALILKEGRATRAEVTSPR
ncbi:MAG: tail fiber domain-containing protein [Saprospiraceae bacterium]|nr:tail fiber domain-containing protein [Saprospiraceae bacterium]